MAPEGFDDRIIDGGVFEHRVFSRLDASSDTLHVYIEGDGRAWVNRTTVSRDPTPQHPVMLELLALDTRPSAYVGRPCYFGLAASRGCDVRQWTSHRYSSDVVASLASVIEVLLAEGGYRHVALFGHSGGGTLATLLAGRLPQTRALVTLAPNLDVGGWAQLHEYSPLHGSLDPASTNDFPAGILQVHWVAGADEAVPANLLLRLQPRIIEGELRLVDGYDHTCCWRDIWPAQLEELDAHFNGSPAATRASASRNARSAGGCEEMFP